jgi:hypothetical protein
VVKSAAVAGAFDGTADQCFLVVGQTTNLDIRTLDLLQKTCLGDAPGTVLLVSHDRDFIDRVATTSR